MSIRSVFAGAVVSLGFAVAGSPAMATTGPGCFGVVNVPNWDVLNIRALTSASSPIVGRIPPQGQGIIAQEGRCLPLSRPMPQRWCQITYYGSGPTVHGFVKRRFVRPGECP